MENFVIYLLIGLLALALAGYIVVAKRSKKIDAERKLDEERHSKALADRLAAIGARQQAEARARVAKVVNITGQRTVSQNPSANSRAMGIQQNYLDSISAQAAYQPTYDTPAARLPEPEPYIGGGGSFDGGGASGDWSSSGSSSDSCSSSSSSSDSGSSSSSSDSGCSSSSSD